MKDLYRTIKHGDKTYKLAFTINVAETIQEKYKSIDEWVKKVSPDGEINLSALKYGLGLMINEGIDIDNFENNTENPHYTDQQIGWILTEIGTDTALSEMAKATTEGAQSAEKN